MVWQTGADSMQHCAKFRYTSSAHGKGNDRHTGQKEIKTYRYKGHSMSDAQHYRTKDEVEEYKKIDPITHVLDIIKNKKYASTKEIDNIQIKVKDLVQECVEFAESSSFPKPEDLYQDVYEGSYNFIMD